MTRSRPSAPPPAAAQVAIARLGAEADGLARLPGGQPVYVPLTLPGETVLARPLAPRGDGWAAAAETIVTPSPDRADPPCRHFGACGGCALQHWRDAPYRAWKAGLLEAALRGAGFTPPPLTLVPSLPGERRRLDFAARRTGAGVVLGLHGARAAEVADLNDCLVLHPALLGLLPPLRVLLRNLRALRRQGAVVINLLDAGPDLLLRTEAPPTLEDRMALTGFARAHGVPRVAWAPTGGSVAEAETICLLRPPTIALSGVAVRPPPGAFLQATAAGERAIIAAVLAGLPTRLPPRARIAELYAGCGTVTCALATARDGRLRIAAWEGEGTAVAALTQGLAQAGLSGRVTVTARDLSRQPLAAGELADAAAVVLDPPHAGAAAQVGPIAAARVPCVIYVSCNPAALGRDARVLHAAGYTLAAATAIDQFLWSARLESVCVFTRP